MSVKGINISVSDSANVTSTENAQNQNRLQHSTNPNGRGSVISAGSRKSNGAVTSPLASGDDTSPRVSNIEREKRTSASKHISHLFTKPKKAPKTPSQKSLPGVNALEVTHEQKTNSYTGSTKSSKSLIKVENQRTHQSGSANSRTSSKSSIKKLYNSNGSLGAIIDIAKTQDIITEEGGVTMEVFVEKYEEGWVNSILKASECIAQTEIEKANDGIPPCVVVASDSVENMKLQQQKEGLLAEPESHSSAGKWAWGSKMGLYSSEKAPSKRSLMSKGSHEKIDRSSANHTRENTAQIAKEKEAQAVKDNSNQNEEGKADDPALHVRPLPQLDQSNSKQSYDNILVDALGETKDNILPLTITATKLAAYASANNSSYHSSSSVNNSNSSSLQSSGSSSQPPSINISNVTSMTTSDRVLSGSSSNLPEPKMKQAAKKASLMDKLKSAFSRKGGKKSKAPPGVGRKEPFKLPENFKLMPILKPAKGADTYVEQSLLSQINSTPNCYKYTRVMPTEINYDSKRVGFSPKAIDITEAIRVLEKGEVLGVGKGEKAIIPVNFIPSSQRIKQD